MTSSGVEECALRARSTHGVHHATCRSQHRHWCRELHVVVRVHIQIVVCDDAVVRRTLVLIALHRRLCFRRSHFHRILLYGRFSLYTPRR